MGADFTILEWKPPRTDGGSKITQYIIQKRESKTAKREDIGKTESQNLAYTVSALREHTDYYFSVCAKNIVGISAPCDAEYAVTPMRPLGM